MTEMPPDSAMCWASWPTDRVHPTASDWLAAEQRMNEISRKDREAGYQGDWGMSLQFTMTTYARPFWWYLFFPE